MKRIFDIIFSFIGLVVMSPVLLVFMYLVWRQDRYSPFYVAPRVGFNGKTFNMVKLRSMVKNAAASGVDSTSNSDMRITSVGHIIRRYKLDEFCQLGNVLAGSMSLVGPRPNVTRDVDLYTREERRLLSVKPGITDFSSIVFADEGSILDGSPDPDLKYNQVIRPWKSRLGLLYIANSSVFLDIKIILLTVLAIVSRRAALDMLCDLVSRYTDDRELLSACRRQSELQPFPPPGATQVVTAR